MAEKNILFSTILSFNSNCNENCYNYRIAKKGAKPKFREQ